MDEKHNNFVEMMLKSSKEKGKPTVYENTLSPDRDPEPAPNKQMTPEEMKEVESLTENLRKKLQQS
jgi:hypothetical protein